MTETDFLHALYTYYPDLYCHIFPDNSKEIVSHVLAFRDKHGLSDRASFAMIYKYITDNEDKHDWWML